MNPFESNIDKLTPELMEKYLSNTLSQKERHEVEKMMLNSSFEAEAMEGFEGRDIDLQTDLSLLNDQLSKRIAKERTYFPTWFKIAASVLIIALSTYLIIENSVKIGPTVNEVADNTPSEPEQDLEKKSTSDILESDSLIALNEEQIDAPSEEAPTPQPIESRQEIADDEEPMEVEELTDLSDDAAIEDFTTDADKDVAKALSGRVSRVQITEGESEPELAEINPVDVSTAGSTTDAETTEKARKKEAFADDLLKRQTRSTLSSNLATNTVTGKVTSAEDGEALPGVNIILKGTTTGTVTDIDGNYSLDIPNKDENTLVASFIGLSATEVEVGDSAVVDIEMNANLAQLSEVVVTGYGTSNNEAEESIIIPARPEGGKSAYKRYLEDNIVTPSDSLKGKVVVRFEVLPDGTLSSFRITKSLGPAYETEALRLIKEGPKWIPATRNDSAISDQVRVRVKFK